MVSCSFAFLIHCYTAFFKNLSIYDIPVTMHTESLQNTLIHVIKDRGGLDFSYSADNELSLTIPYLDLFSQVALEEIL